MHDEMEKKGREAKKSSLSALHKLMKDLHHKSMAGDSKEEPHAAAIEVDIEHSPISESEHDEENDGPGVNPFNDSQMEGDQAAELADHSHETEEKEMHPDAHLPEAHMEDESEEDSEEPHSDMKLPQGLHEMIMKHLKK